MKMTTGILGCALAAGLMTFAADKAQAGVVVNNELYSPLQLMISGQYVKNGKITKFSVNSKEVLKDLGYNSNVQLALSRDSGDVWVINKTALVKDISVAPNDFLFIDFSGTYVGTTKGTTYTETGITYVDFYDGGYVASGDGSANWFETQGVYSYKDNDGKVNSKGTYKDSESYSTKNLSGDGAFSSVSGSDTLPVTGSASYKGSGTLPGS